MLLAAPRDCLSACAPCVRARVCVRAHQHACPTLPTTTSPQRRTSIALVLYTALVAPSRHVKEAVQAASGSQAPILQETHELNPGRVTSHESRLMRSVIQVRIPYYSGWVPDRSELHSFRKSVDVGVQ
jgi:hypothetical protein